MKITNKLFKSLNQLDRIEYRQQVETILKICPNGEWVMTFICSFMFLIFIIPSFLAIVISKQYAMDFLIMMKEYTIIWGILGISCMLVDTIIIMKKDKAINKLNEEYFNFNVELKNGRKK